MNALSFGQNQRSAQIRLLGERGERLWVASIFAAVEKATFEQAVTTMGLVGKSETIEHRFAIRIRRDGDPEILDSPLQRPNL